MSNNLFDILPSFNISIFTEGRVDINNIGDINIFDFYGTDITIAKIKRGKYGLIRNI